MTKKIYCIPSDVFVNGVKIDNVVYADEESGLVIHALTYENGDVIIDRTELDVIMCRLHGSVTVTPKFDAINNKMIASPLQAAIDKSNDDVND